MAGNKSKRPERRKQRVPENKKRKQRQSKKVRNDKNQRNDNVVVYKPPVNINLGLGIFVLLIGYLAIIIISYLKSKPITPYEVSMGSLAVNNTYTGVALREEVLVSADYSGYVGILNIHEVSEPQIWKYNGEDLTVCDNNYQWLTIMPENDYYCITVMMNFKMH